STCAARPGTGSRQTGRRKPAANTCKNAACSIPVRLPNRGQPHVGLTDLIDTATKAGITEVVVADLSRLGGRPQASMRNLNALKGAGLTLHAATGTLSGPVLEECIAATMFEFAA